MKVIVNKSTPEFVLGETTRKCIHVGTFKDNPDKKLDLYFRVVEKSIITDSDSSGYYLSRAKKAPVVYFSFAHKHSVWCSEGIKEHQRINSLRSLDEILKDEVLKVLHKYEEIINVNDNLFTNGSK